MLFTSVLFPPWTSFLRMTIVSGFSSRCSSLFSNVLTRTVCKALELFRNVCSLLVFQTHSSIFVLIVTYHLLIGSLFRKFFLALFPCDTQLFGSPIKKQQKQKQNSAYEENSCRLGHSLICKF